MRAKVALALALLSLVGCFDPSARSDGGLPACGSRGVCSTGVCDRRLNRCVACRNSADCFSGQVCAGGSCVAATACASDPECFATGQQCDPSGSRCVQCRTSAECDGGQACLGFSCTAVTACTSIGDCAPGPQVCLPASAPRFPAALTQACQDCTGAADCAPGTGCYQGVCDADTCTQLSRCSGDARTSPADVATCEDKRSATGAKCYRESFALSNCVLTNQTCGVDNKTDLAATLSLCVDESNAYTSCANSP